MSGRQHVNGAGPVPLPSNASHLQQDVKDSNHLSNHARDASGSRGRGPALPNIAVSNMQSQQTNSEISLRSQSSASTARSPAIPERRPSMNRNHYRQTSRAPSNHPQSRNAIFVASPATSPLSPETPGSAGTTASQHDFSNYALLRRQGSKRYPGDSSTTLNTAIHAPSASLNSIGDREPGTANDTSLPPKRLDRTQTSRSRSGQHHHRAQSRQQHGQKSVGEFALHHLFQKFLVQADQKIELCISSPPEMDTLDRICGADVDAELDQLISALAHINRKQPRSLVDTMMLWRKSKGEELIKAKELASNNPSTSPVQRTLPRRTTATSNLLNAMMSDVGNVPETTAYSMTVSMDVYVYQAEQIMAVSIYLLCRVLIEVYNKSDVYALNPDLARKVEEIIFSQLRTMDPDKDFTPYPFRYSYWKLYGQLLGVMSSTNFRSVTQRFTNELAFYQQDLNPKGGAGTLVDAKAELLILAMRHIHVRAENDASWKESCDYLHRLGELFADSHGLQIKHAYCQTLEDLVMPIAASWRPLVNTQRWKDFLNMVNSRVSQMVVKPKHWREAFRLSIVMLCASPSEHFAAQWYSVATSQQAKLKDRAHSREIALQAICRLVWTYLYRINEPSSSVVRKLEDVMKVVLPSGKKSYLSNDSSFSEPIIELIRIIGSGHREYCFRNIIFPLINSELFAPGKDTKVEQLEPEKIVIGIKAFLKIMEDLETADSRIPPFPRFEGGGLAMDPRMVPGAPYTSQPVSVPASSVQSDKEYSSRPVDTSRFEATSKEFYSRFCEVLGKITLICDNAFGGQAVLDEKFGSITPKTPLTETFTFGRKDEHLGSAEHRQGFYELFHTAVQALPRCLSSHIPLKSLINLLCTGTAHVHTNIALSSANSLKSIARQGLAQPVTIGFARFIFSFDARYSTMSEEGLLGPGHIESTLRLYVELLQIWIEEIGRKSREIANEKLGDGSSVNRSLQLDLTSVEVLVEEVEAHGIFFLCSQAKVVRIYAIKVLKLVTEFDTALGRANPRIIQILEGDSQRIMDINDEQLTVAERSRLQKGKRKSAASNTLIELCGSDVPHEATLWLKLFPNIIRLSYELCNTAVTLGREIVCTRLLQMQDSVNRLSSDARGPVIAGVENNIARNLNRLGTQSPEVIIEQWKMYLVMACTTMTVPGAQTQSQLDKTQHTRKVSRGIQQGQDKISSARQLFANIIPLLSAAQTSIRDAIVTALGSININLYRTLLESLQYAVTTCKEEAKQRIGIQHQRTGSHPRRNPSTDRLRTEVTQVYRLTARFLHEPAVLQDEWILNNLCTYTKDLMIFLNDANVQNDWACQKLRRQYCGLMEELFESISRTAEPSKYISFDSRKSAFALMEDWGGYSSNQARIDQREHIWQYDLEQHPDTGERTNVTVTIEIEKKNLKTAALSAMAALCAGPVRVSMDRSDSRSFDVRRMLSWIHQIFEAPSDRNHTIGRRALCNLITHNPDTPYLLERSIERWYVLEPPRALESYFEVVTKVLTEQPDYPLAFWRILAASLFTLGNEKSEIRMKSAKLLRVLEQRQRKNSKIQDFDISISDRTTAVYKLAQFEISRRLASQHTELAFFIFSQFSVHFRTMPPDSQRNMIAAILPWTQVIELQVESNGRPTAQSYMLLANLLEITTTASGALHNEIQALWQALATGPHAGNVQLILDFVISLCLDRREQGFVSYAKQIIVYLSSTHAGQKVVEFLLLQITSRNMVQKPQEPKILPPDNLGLPYVADLSQALPIGNKQHGFSLSQLSMIFLVDLMVSPMKLSKESVPLLLQIVMVLWDHYTALVQDQAQEMLVHLIHELVITKIEDDSTTPNKKTIESFVEAIRQHEPNVVWTYDEVDGKALQDDNKSPASATVQEGSRVPASMFYVTTEVVNLFRIAYPQIQAQWAKLSLNWATSCPVRHTACRSLQVFRCILTSFDRAMLSDILARLSNTIVDKTQEVQIFSLEILTTIQTIIEALAPTDLLQYPQLFWTTCACLDTIYEREFIATLHILEKLLEKIDFSNASVVAMLEKAKPKDWRGQFEGIAPLVYKGLKSDMSVDKTLQVMNRLVTLPSNELIGTRSRLLFGTLANLPAILQSFEDKITKSECYQSAQALASVANFQEGCQEVSQVLNTFAKARYLSSDDFLSQVIAALRQAFFPTWELKTLIFLIGLLTNRLDWYKLKTLKILLFIIRDVDTRRTEIVSQGPDLISPLLRLLQTQYCDQALEVLDHMMIMSETPMSKHHLRMSMVGCGQRNERQAYDRTQSLYGIPEETGWSIPMPALHTNSCRENMQAVYLACLQADSAKAEATPTPEIEFHVDEDHQGSYFPMERSGTLTSEHSLADSGVGTMDGGMGDLVNKLDSLDDFFGTDDADEDTNRYSNVTITPHNHNTDNNAEFYDQQTAPILHHSLNRTPSVSSLHNDNSYQDRYHDLRIPSGTSMNPTAFNPSPTVPVNTILPPAAQPIRPALHSRSVTSPTNNLTKAANSVGPPLPSDDEADETISEDERSTTHVGARLLGSTSLRGAQSNIRKMAPGLEGKDYRQRGLLRAQSRSKSQAPGSPSVPKVPEAYLQQQQQHPLPNLRPSDTF